MKSSKWFFLSFVVLFFCGLYLIYSAYSTTSKYELPDQVQVPITASKPAPTVELSINEGAIVEATPVETEIVDLNEVEEPLEEDSRVTGPQNVEQVWLPINPSPELAELKPKSQAITEIQAIEFDNIEQFRALMEGDTATLLLPNGESIQVVIDESQTQNQGVQTWAGNFESQGSSFPVTFTFGQNAIMGFIGHPQGSIKIEGSGHQAWVYQVPDSHGFEHDPQLHDRAH